MNLKNSFLKHCKINKFDINQNQIKTIELLEKYYIQNFKKTLLKKIFKKNSEKLGLYLFGGVGVGKTMILDFFLIILILKNKGFTLMNL